MPLELLDLFIQAQFSILIVMLPFIVVQVTEEKKKTSDVENELIPYL